MSTCSGLRRSRVSIVMLSAALVWPSLLPHASRAQSASAEPFVDGDRWCVIGDSITHSGTWHDEVMLYYLTRHPDRTITSFNCGIGGDTAAGALRRLEWDVLSKRPTVCSVMLGMNDINRSLYGDDKSGPDVEQKRRRAIDDYKQNMRTLVDRLQTAGTKVILITPSLFDQTAELDRPKQTGAADALAECAEFCTQLAREKGTGLVDFFGPMRAINQERQAKDPTFTVVGRDRVHPGAPGHLLMAYLFLRAQGAGPIIGRLEVDLRNSQVLGADNGTVEDIRKQPDGSLMFTWASRALPFPVDPDAAPALEWVPFINDLDQEILNIAGLRRGRYELRVDDLSIGEFTAEQLAGGINIAIALATPQHQQALDVLRVVKARAEVVSNNLRQIARVEHRVAESLPRPLTLEQVRPLVDERLGSLSPEASNANFRRALELYPERKAREAEAAGSIDRLGRLARLTAQPRSHIYMVRPAR